MRGQSVTNLIITALFLIGICLPGFGFFFPGFDNASVVVEKRTRAEIPTFDWIYLDEFPRCFERYFNDNFGFRSALIRLDNLVRLRYLNTSSSDKVLAGKDGWLYYTGGYGKDGNPVANHLGGECPDLTAGFKRWRQRLETRRDSLARRGIRYLFVIAPDKWTIYPEFLPDGFTTNQPSVTDRFVAYLQATSELEVVDLRKPLLDAKKEGRQLYNRHGSHWNALGAFYGYSELATALERHFPAIEPRQLSDFELVQTVTASGGDLAMMLSAQDYLQDTEYTLIPRRSDSAALLPTATGPGGRLVYIREGSHLPKAWLLRDSFADRLIPLLAQHFSTLTAQRGLHGDFDQSVEKIRPDVVIEEVVERYLVL